VTRNLRLVAVVWVLAALAFSQGQDFRQVDGLADGRGAFGLHRPYAFHNAIGQLHPGAEFVLVNQAWPEVLGEATGKAWITEALIGGGKAREVRWIELADGEAAALGASAVAGRLIWDGRDSLLGDVSLVVGEGVVDRFVVVRVGEDAVRVLDARLLADDLVALAR
jgi:hypothetical protein